MARSTETVQNLASESPDSSGTPTDLRQIENISQVIDKIFANYGRVDILINNAGRAFHTPIELTDVQLYRQSMDLNVISVMRAMQCVIPIMRKQDVE